jgi:hypothetical protein
MNRMRTDSGAGSAEGPAVPSRWPARRPRPRLVLAAAVLGAVLALCPGAPVAAAAGEPLPLAPGDPLPALRGDLLSGRRFVMPDSAAGRNTLLLLGFSYESRHDVEKWAARFQREHGRDARVQFFEVPVIGTAGRLGRPFIDGSMRRGLPQPMHDRVLMVYRDAGRWKRLAGHANPDIGYLLLVGRDGRVLWRGQGPYGEEAWGELSARLARLAAE